MVIAKIYVDGVSANVTDLQKITKGIAGAVIEVTYAPNWEGLNKTAVFSGAVTRDVLNADGDILVPTETVARSGYRLKVGFYGVDGEKNVIIPTLWADLGIIQDAADPSGDPGTDPELPVWAQLQKEFEELKEAGGLKGDPGFSPIAKVTQTESGAEISITDKDGTTTATVENGKPGAPGNDYVLTDADKTEIAEMAAELVEVPEASMKPLTFTGAVNATYDGSEAVTVEIPQGGGSASGWELIGEAISDGTSSIAGIYVPVNFAEYTELFVSAHTVANIFCRVLISKSTSWSDGLMLNSNAKNMAAGAAGTGDPVTQALLLQTSIKNIAGQLFPFSGWNSGYSGNLGVVYRYMVPIASPRSAILAEKYAYVRMDTSNNADNPSVPEGNWIKVYGRK